VLDGKFSLLPSTLKNIEFLLAIQQAQTLVHAAADICFRAIRDQHAGLQATFDAENDLVGILGVLGEILVQQVQRVVLWCAVQLTTVPEVGPEL
jgi:hypothetical protein